MLDSSARASGRSQLVQTRTNPIQIWRFGVFEVDAQQVELCRSGIPVKLREQSFRILVFLLEHAGEIVTREELRLVLWPSDIYVDFDHSLNTAVMKLRHALGDSADTPLYIETLPKRGYRFIAPVTPLAPVSHTDTVQPPPHHPPELHAPTAFSAIPSGETIDPTPPPAFNPIALPTFRPRHRRRFVPSNTVLSIVLLTAFGCAFLLRARSVPYTSAGTNRGLWQQSIQPVTSDQGDAIFPVLSPDAREVAYAWNGPERKRYELYTQAFGSDRPRRLTYSNGGIIGPPAWSPDGTQIAFSRCDGQNDGIYVIPIHSVDERKVTTVACLFTLPGPVAWLPDGESLLIVDQCSPGGPFGVVLFSLPTGNKRCITNAGASKPSDSGFSFALSPDSKTIVYKSMTGSLCCDIFAVPVSGGVPRQLTSEAQLGCNSLTEFACSDLMWTPDSQSVIFSSSRMALTSLWRVSATGGTIERDKTYPAIGSFSKDGHHFIYSESTSPELPSIWKADLNRPGGSVLTNRRLISTQYAEMNAQPSPDGAHVVWMSIRTGFEELWKADSTGANASQLTHLYRYSGAPRWSPDGKSVAFDSYTRDSAQIFVTDASGRSLRSVTDDPSTNTVPSWSHDGQTIYFASKRTGTWQVWRHSLATGAESPLTQRGGFNPFESLDGKSIYFTRMDRPGIWSVPAHGGAEASVLHDKPQLGYWGDWALTRTGIYLLNTEADPTPSIEFYDFTTHTTKPVLALKEQPARQQPGLSATPDGRTLYYTQYDRQSAIKLINFSP